MFNFFLAQNLTILETSPVFSISVLRYCKVSFYLPTIDIVLFYGKYTDIDMLFTSNEKSCGKFAAGKFKLHNQVFVRH